MKSLVTLTLLMTLVALAGSLPPTTAYAQGDSYCDGHREGHRSGSDTFGMGYPGYPGCPGDPGSSGGNASPYQRGFAAGMRDITRQMCRQNPTHQNCR